MVPLPIIVTDWDPKIAADIANEITCQLDTVKNKIEHERARFRIYPITKTG